MAYRVEIGEIVENATGLNVSGALVTVKYHGGANAPVYDAENGGSQLTQPLATVNGKIGGDYPSGAWVAEGDYDLVVAGGAPAGGDLTFFWPARRGTQFVTTLPAGVGTSAPEDAEFAIELYDGVNGAAWLRRYRAAASAWDMIGGPPPAGGALPGTPRTRQEFYLTGSTPPVQHMRYNGASWDYVGTPPTVPATGSPLSILETGQSGHHRAGHELSLADFSTLAGLPTTPVLLANLTTLTSNLGTGGALTNKNATLNGNGIDGSATAAQFRGASGVPANDPVLYIVDTGANDPFRIKTGSVGCWFKTAKRATDQRMMSKWGPVNTSWVLYLTTGNIVAFATSSSGTAATAQASGVTDICDDRWHFAVGTHDGTMVKIYVDGILEASAIDTGFIAGTAEPFNIGGQHADGGTGPTNPHYGRVDEAFVTPDVLTEDQVRLLYAAKIPHGYASTPTRAELSVRRKRRGAALVSADFPSQPKRLHSFTAGALTDAGSDNQALTNNGTALTVAGADGTKDGAFNFVAGSSQSLSSTDTGLPGTTTSRSFGAWFKTTLTTGAPEVMAWGGVLGTNDARIFLNGGLISADGVSGPFAADGQWHHVVVVEENAPIDGLKVKLYLDGRLVGTSAALLSITLTGANRFRIGAHADGTNFFTGQIDEAFVFAGVLTAEQIQVLYQKSSQALGSSIKETGAHVEAFDATNVYFVGDTLDTNNTIDLAVAA